MHELELVAFVPRLEAQGGLDPFHLGSVRQTERDNFLLSLYTTIFSGRHSREENQWAQQKLLPLMPSS